MWIHNVRYERLKWKRYNLIAVAKQNGITLDACILKNMLTQVQASVTDARIFVMQIAPHCKNIQLFIQLCNFQTCSTNGWFYVRAQRKEGARHGLDKHD